LTPKRGSTKGRDGPEKKDQKKRYKKIKKNSLPARGRLTHEFLQTKWSGGELSGGDGEKTTPRGEEGNEGCVGVFGFELVGGNTG